MTARTVHNSREHSLNSPPTLLHHPNPMILLHTDRRQAKGEKINFSTKIGTTYGSILLIDLVHQHAPLTQRVLRGDSVEHLRYH